MDCRCNCSKDAAPRVGFGRGTINPEPGISLAGYFNARPNTGVMDDLFVKVMIFEVGGERAGVIAFDLVSVSADVLRRVREGMRERGYPFADTIPLCATHTHTGPHVGGVLGDDLVKQAYVDHAVARALEAVEAAIEDLAPAEVLAGSVEDNPFAFNRRYWMKDGTVVTNPGKLNPDIVKPEGTVDREVGVVAVKREGRLAGMIVNITNHNDTTGGVKVSADWPGHMERAVQAELGEDVSVMGLIAPSGNINHFDVTDPNPQTSPEESLRIGRGYAEVVLRALETLEPVRPEPMRAASKTVMIPFRNIKPDELDEARETLKRTVRATQGDLTSEGLAQGDETILRFFAEQLLEYVKFAKGARHEDSLADLEFGGRPFDIAALKFGEDLALVFFPGEPFTEIGLAVKAASPFKRTFVFELSNGACGYVALKECFGRGGYETLPVVGGGPREDTCDLMIETALELLEQE